MKEKLFKAVRILSPKRIISIFKKILSIPHTADHYGSYGKAVMFIVYVLLGISRLTVSK